MFASIRPQGAREVGDSALAPMVATAQDLHKQCTPGATPLYGRQRICLHRLLQLSGQSAEFANPSRPGLGRCLYLFWRPGSAPYHVTR